MSPQARALISNARCAWPVPVHVDIRVLPSASADTDAVVNDCAGPHLLIVILFFIHSKSVGGDAEKGIPDPPGWANFFVLPQIHRRISACPSAKEKQAAPS